MVFIKSIKGVVAMFNPLPLLTNLKGSFNTILVILGFFVLGYIGFKFYSMNSKIEAQKQTNLLKDGEIKTEKELYKKTVDAYEISIVNLEFKSYNEALKKELKSVLLEVSSDAEHAQKELIERLKNEKDICPSKCYSDLVF